jgi:glutamine amidotransferase
MCLLIFKPDGQTVPDSYLHEAAISNPHGAGIAWPGGIAKGPRWTGRDVIKALGEIGDAPAIIHFRYATHGAVDIDNAHPFALPKGVMVAHNGVISGMPCKPNESDTRAYLRTRCLEPLKAGQDVTDKTWLASLATEVGAGNKLVFMDKLGRHGIVNEQSGHWREGVWYSNYTYENQYPWRDALDDYADYSFQSYVEDVRCDCCGVAFDALPFGSSVLFNSLGGFICQRCKEEI